MSPPPGRAPRRAFSDRYFLRSNSRPDFSDQPVPVRADGTDGRLAHVLAHRLVEPAGNALEQVVGVVIVLSLVARVTHPHCVMRQQPGLAAGAELLRHAPDMVAIRDDPLVRPYRRRLPYRRRSGAACRIRTGPERHRPGSVRPASAPAPAAAGDSNRRRRARSLRGRRAASAMARRQAAVRRA